MSWLTFSLCFRDEEICLSRSTLISPDTNLISPDTNLSPHITLSSPEASGLSDTVTLSPENYYHSPTSSPRALEASQFFTSYAPCGPYSEGRKDTLEIAEDENKSNQTAGIGNNQENWNSNKYASKSNQNSLNKNQDVLNSEFNSDKNASIAKSTCQNSTPVKRTLPQNSPG